MSEIERRQGDLVYLIVYFDLPIFLIKKTPHSSCKDLTLSRGLQHTVKQFTCSPSSMFAGFIRVPCPQCHGCTGAACWPCIFTSLLSRGCLTLSCATLTSLKGLCVSSAHAVVHHVCGTDFLKRSEFCSSHRLLPSCPGMALLEVVKLQVEF